MALFSGSEEQIFSSCEGGLLPPPIAPLLPLCRPIKECDR